MGFDDLMLLLPVRRIAFQRRIAVFDRHPLVGVDGFEVGGLSCGALLLESIGERDIVGKGTAVAHLSQPTPTVITLILPVRPAPDMSDIGVHTLRHSAAVAWLESGLNEPLGAPVAGYAASSAKYRYRVARLTPITLPPPSG